MTAAAPDVLDETILEELANIQTACEWHTRRRRGGEWIPCTHPACWIARMMCALGHQSMSLICDPHHENLIEQPQTFACHCGHVGRPALYRCERI